MRYHYNEQEGIREAHFGKVYIYNHPVYSRCTLYKIRDKGLSVIQQRYDAATKHTYWTEIDEWLVDRLYLHPKFKEYFDKHCGTCKNGLYPTVTIRQIMWGLRMKPLKKERWETVFDRKDI